MTSPIIVGIGASAGGLTAFEGFFSKLSTEATTSQADIAFILVQHLAPDHKSILCELVSRYTQMKVFEVEDGMTVQPNCAYVIPPNHDMILVQGKLRLQDPIAPRGQRLPIDSFFRSLAQDQRERAIGIVLSGTGSDGTQGLRAIKGEGGMAMAQTPESTEYDGMPRSAIATGLVDYVLTPAEMPAQLISYVERVFGKTGTMLPSRLSLPSEKEKLEDLLRQLFNLLRVRTGHDFTLYKRSTIFRRIERRMVVHRTHTLEQYLQLLQQDVVEVDALFRDLLIGVTHFFRDSEAFKALETVAIPKLLAGKPPGSMIRVWVPGCSTGEEAYSIAILLQESIERLKQYFRFQIFATDIDGRAIAHARAGVYPASIAADLSQERLARFFLQDQEGGAYRISKDLRDLLVFSEQDVTAHPPFSKLDLISCRNLLIYLEAALQKKLIPLFHYALNSEGLLFLGTSEAVGEFSNLFVTLDRPSKIFQKKDDALRSGYAGFGKFIPAFPTRHERSVLMRPLKQPPAESGIWLRELTERTLLEQYLTAVAVLINERGDILYLHGRTGQYLEPAPGETEMNVLKMAREGLRTSLATAFYKAVMDKVTVRHSGVKVRNNGSCSEVDLSVIPVAPGSGNLSVLFLVVLEERGNAQVLKQPEDSPVQASDFEASIVALKRELRAKEECLQATNEELETSNEEFKSTNEELQSVNEELQSTNEELETSKEELQSVNEELATVNNELQNKVTDLSRANNDLNNLLAGTGVGTIFVDHRLLIQRFTPAVTQIINLIPSDVSRPVGDIVSNLVGYEALVPDIREVLDTLIPKEIEVQAKTGAWYLLRIRPYRTLDNVIEGAVITFVEITDLKRGKEAQRESEGLRRLAVVVRDAYDAITVQALSGQILAWNRAAERMYGWSEAEALAMNIRQLIPDEIAEKALLMMQQLVKADILEPFRMQRLTKDGRRVEILLTATALINESGEVYAIATTERLWVSKGSDNG